MSHRDDFSENLIRFRSRERAEFEDAPVRAAQAENERLIRELHATEKQAVLDGKPDPGFVIPESAAGKRMGAEEAKQFNATEARKFKDNTPEFYNSPANIQTLCDYVLAQGVRIANEDVWRAAYERCTYLGLLEQRPEPEPQLESASAEPVQEQPQGEIGIDGRFYSNAEIWRMSADEYKRAFGLYGDRRPRVEAVLFPQ